MALLFVTVGLPGAGKTTRAKELASEHAALRLTPDPWMIPLFGEPEANGKRDVLEGRFIWLALEALKIGTNVVLDFGCWSRDERSALRSMVSSVGASCVLIYLSVDRATQLERVNRRLAETPGETFVMTEVDLDTWRAEFEVPDEMELSGGELGPPPLGSLTWSDWAASRWPSVFDA